MTYYIQSIYIYILQTELLGKNVKLFAENASRNFSTVFGAIFTDWTLCPPSNQGDRILLEEHNSSKIYTVQKTRDKKQKDMKGRVCKLSNRFTYLHINFQIYDLFVSFHHLLLLFVTYIFWLLYVGRLPVMKMYQFLYRCAFVPYQPAQKLPQLSLLQDQHSDDWSSWPGKSLCLSEEQQVISRGACRSAGPVLPTLNPPYAPCMVYVPWTLW